MGAGHFFDYAFLYFIPVGPVKLTFEVPFSYDRDGLLISADAVTLTRDKGNGLISEAITDFVGNPVFSDQYGRNEFGEIVSFHSQNKVGSKAYFDQTFSRDDLGRIIAKQETNENGVATNFGYSYDQAGRLTSVSANGIEVSRYNYDSNSNRLSKVTPQGTVTGYYDGKDRVLSYGNFNFTYTKNGEIASKRDSDSGQQMQMSYDVLGNLKQVALSDGNQIQYEVDGLGRRLSRTATVGVNAGTYRYFTNSEGLIYGATYQTNSSSPTTTFYQFAYVDGSNTPFELFYSTRDSNGKNIVSGSYKYTYDERGSVRQVINGDTGVVGQAIDYDEFGNVVRDTHPGFQPFGFAGCLYDVDTKLCHFGAREYDASIGRWLQRDPIGFKGGDTNLYGYVLNDPMNYVDPSGKNAAIGAAVCGAIIVGGVILAIVNKAAYDQCVDDQNQRNKNNNDPLEEHPKSCDYIRTRNPFDNMRDIFGDGAKPQQSTGK